MIAFLSDNGWSFDASADEAEPAIVQLAASGLGKDAFTDWLRAHVHEKPRLELREFFEQIDPEGFSERFLSLLPCETGANPAELARLYIEARSSIPILPELARLQHEAEHSDDNQKWERITMLAVGILTLYVLAEDMGYEW